jgi:hypothetical protein
MGESFGLGKTCSVGFEPADAQYGAKTALPMRTAGVQCSSALR